MPAPRLSEVEVLTVPCPHPEPLRERISRLGPAAIPVQDLLSALLGRQGASGSGSQAQRLLAMADGLVGLSGLDLTALRNLDLSNGDAIRIAVAFELSRRLSQARRRDRRRLKTPEDVVAALGTSMVGLAHEELWCLPLDPQSRLIGEPRVVSKGDIDGCDAGPRAFFRLALMAGATSAIAVHNHPSSEVTPSNADYDVTRRLALAGASVDLALVDHVVLGAGGSFTSIRRTRPELFR
jgi:DNA repair protein RadC